MKLLKCTCILFFLLFAIQGIAQRSAHKPKSKFSFGFSFSPDYTYRVLKSDVNENTFIDSRNKLEAARFGFTTGLSVKYRLSRNWVLESGLQYADRGDKIDTDKTDYVFPDNESDPFIPDRTKTVYHYYYLGVPLKANFYVVNKRAKVFLSAGVSADFFSGSKTKQVHFYAGNEHVTTYSEEGVDFNNFNLLGLAGIGFEYGLNTKINLRFEPIARYSFSSLTTYSDVKTHLYSLGANFAVYFTK